ncbi:hypothetical protein CO151_03600 [bacterium CG_4_9_14_3_um_filter_65_15]|nr:MAG: hypothetical protein CO151_03600 [bacterium CG_4_9_14_3_um_filter_65_15]
MNIERKCLPIFARVTLTLLLLGLAIPTDAQTAGGALAVSIGDGLATIGQNLQMEVTVTPPTGQSLAPGTWDLQVSGNGGPFLDEAYPVEILEPPSGPGSTTTLRWTAPVPSGAEVGPRELHVVFTGNWSDGSPVRLTWTGSVPVDYGSDWTADKISSYIERKGLGLFLAAVFGFGLLMSLSPCIYPMIPITLAVIGARTQDKGPAHGLMLSVTYVVGMALVYAILGALSATVFSGITAFMQSPYVLVPIALLMAGLALSMFGAYELEAPAFLRDRLQKTGGGQGGNLLGVLVMGMVAGLVASPCVGPFLAALLVWVATTGNVMLGFFSLFTFGIGMGMLLIGVGTFPSLMGSMPSSGGWMVTVRNGMGLILLAMAFYFVRPGAVLPATFFYPLLGITTVLVAVFMGAFDSVTPETGWWAKTRKGLGLCTLTAGLIILLIGFSLHFDLPSLLPVQDALQTAETVRVTPTDQTRGTGSAESVSAPREIEFTVVQSGPGAQDFLTAKRAEAKAAGKPMLIDFWASWCVYCKKLDKLVWHDPAVAAEAARFVTIKVDATAPDDDEMTAIKEELKVPGLPRVVFIDSRGKILDGLSTGFQEADKMLDTLQKVR